MTVGEASVPDGRPRPVIAIIGAGVMGETFIGGLLRAGYQPGQIVISERDDTRRSEISTRFGVDAVSLPEAAALADVALLAVKPVDARTVLAEVGPLLQPGALLVSIAAGVSTATMASMVAPGVGCIRAMPNTPAVIGEGMTAMSIGAGCTPEAIATATDMLEVIGQVAVVSEDLQDAVTAISGSGPAYVFAFMEALEAAGIELGLSSETARALVLQTLAGAALLARDSEHDPGELRRRVTSPGGTTQAALGVLTGADAAGGDLAELVARATRAARDRSIELGREA